jgi:predicted DsbA family dithiol-disulfide isomerase
MRALNRRVTITVFGDPMQGLCYESEPLIERLRDDYGDTIAIRYVMSLLVRDVSDFMLP